MSTVKHPHYVSNKLLYEEYEKWYRAIEEAKLAGKPEPGIPPFILDAMIKISTKLSYSPKFINYSYREDMISDAQYDCIRFAKSFKLTYINKEGEPKLGNPFSYITTISIRAFFRRIDSEKTESYVKAMLISELPLHEFFDSIDPDDTDMQQAFNDLIAGNSDNLVNNEPMALKRKRKKLAEKAALEEGEEVELDEAVSLEDFEDE